MPAPRLNPFIGYADFLLVILAFVVALVQVQAKSEGPKNDAEYIVTATWGDRVDADVDLWGLPPPGDHPVFYNDREVGALHLDRDSRGFLDNRIANADGSFTYLPNREVMTIRGRVPGPYVFGLQLYAGHVAAPVDVVVHVEAVKVKPEAKTIFARDFHLHAVNEAVNALAFTVNGDGDYHIDDLPLRSVSDLFYLRPAGQPPQPNTQSSQQL